MLPLKIRHHCVSHQRAAAAQLHRHPSHHFPSREAAPRQPAVWAEKLERRRLNRAAFYMQQCFTQQQLCNALHFDSPAPLPRQQQAGQARGNARNPIKQLHSAKGPPSPDPQGPQPLTVKGVLLLIGLCSHQSRVSFFTFDIIMVVIVHLC